VLKAVVLGADGQVGRALLALAPAGCEAVGLSREQCDVTRPEMIRAVLDAARPDIVFNAAAYTAVDRAESQPDRAKAINANGAGLVAAGARASGARIVHISTDFVFGGERNRPLGPEDAIAPQGVYARTKADGEQAVRAADPDALIVRTAWVYAEAGASFVGTMLRLMAERDSLGVVADQVGTPTWASSLAQALWRLAQTGATGLHHFTDAGVASWYDFAVAIEEEARAAGLLQRPCRVVPIATADYPTPAPRPAYSVLDKSGTWPLLDRPPPHWRVNLRHSLKKRAQRHA
jgi:dTDP-4-dehydrorhamnose reductase